MAADPTGSARKKPIIDRSDWYSLSLDSLRGWAILLALIVVAVLGVFGYRALQRMSTHRQAVMITKEAEGMLARVQTEVGGATTSETYPEAERNLTEARVQLSEGNYEQALISARWSRNLFSSLLADMRNKAPSGEAQFIDVQGGVEFRRGDGPWQVARSRIVLRAGDYVKTSGSGSAEVTFSDSTSFRVRPNTVVLINQKRVEDGKLSEDAVTLEYGWIKLDTANGPSRVSTPEAVARVARGSKAELTYDRERRQTRFSSFEGMLEIETKVGTIRRLGTEEQVQMTAAGLGSTVKLPGSPEPLFPEAGSRLQLSDKELVLRWKRVDAATRYALQVSRDDHFVENIIDVEDRSDTSATIGLVDEGKFLWRVAAFNRLGYKGPWSEPRVFEIEGELDGGELEPARSGAG